MKTLLISITHGFQARDLLRTDVYRLIRLAGVRVVIATPNYKDEYFVCEFGGPNVSFERLDTTVGRFEAVLGAFRRYVLASFKLNQTINALNERFHKSRSPRYVAVRALNAVFGRVPLLRRLWMRLEAALFPGRQYDALFRRYRPDLLVTGTPGTIPADAHLLRCARRFNVRSACIVLSWDNLTSKGHMAAVPDELIVWNRIMLREAEELHGYPPERVQVAGVSHFDVYARPSAAGSREAFCRSLGLDPARALVTLGTVTPWLFPHNAETAEILAHAVQDGRLCRPAQLVIRLHPQVMSPGTAYSENIDRFRQLAACHEHVHLDLPRVRSKSLMWDVAESDMTHLADLLRYSDVTLNAGSTLSIDSAIVDTPIVNIGFDGYHTLPAEQSVLRVYEFTHYANIVRTGGVRIARSADEMIALINEYLRDRSLDRAGRARIVEEQCYRIDGRSGQRVGALLLSMLGLPSAVQAVEDGSVSRDATETSRVAHG
jgi:hypothetical protein